MVNAAVTLAAEAERALALGYAPQDRRAGLAALFALDARLGDVVRTTRQPLVGQMRLAWWRDALAALRGGPAPAEPVLIAIRADALHLGVNGDALAAMADGWEQLLAEPLDAAAVETFARERGGRLFDQAAVLLGVGGYDVGGAGEGWALADLAGHLGNTALASEAGALARRRLVGVTRGRWPRALRPLGALALLARSDLDGGRPGSPARVARLLAHRLTGR